MVAAYLAVSIAAIALTLILAPPDPTSPPERPACRPPDQGRRLRAADEPLTRITT